MRKPGSISCKIPSQRVALAPGRRLGASPSRSFCFPGETPLMPPAAGVKGTPRSPSGSSVQFHEPVFHAFRAPGTVLGTEDTKVVSRGLFPHQVHSPMKAASRRFYISGFEHRVLGKHSSPSVAGYILQTWPQRSRSPTRSSCTVTLTFLPSRGRAGTAFPFPEFEWACDLGVDAV